MPKTCRWFLRGRAVVTLFEFRREIIAFMEPFIHLDICMEMKLGFRL
jgi:hypothetical protein